jgi:predicted porin
LPTKNARNLLCYHAYFANCVAICLNYIRVYQTALKQVCEQFLFFSPFGASMKKSLIAMAVLAVSGVASAQSNVNLYGLVDAYVGTLKVNGLRQTGVNLANPSGGSGGGFNTSRFGLKGSEDLGGGLKANFLLEAGFDPSTGAANNYTNPFTGSTSSAIFGRQSWVGLSGGFGEIKLGKMWTPYDEVKGSGAAAFDANIFAPAANVWLSNNYNDRPGNSIYYSTPSFSGFSAAAMYAFGENKANAVGTTPPQNAGKIVSANVQYANGPIGVALSHQQEKASSLSPTTTKFTQLNGSYNFNVVKILAAYGQVKNGSTFLFSGVPTAGYAVNKAKEFQLGLDVPIGAVTLSGGVATSKVTLAAGGSEIKRNGFGLAAKYDLSKRTFLYTGLQYAKEKNLPAAAPDGKLETFAVGVQHKF